MLESDIVAHCAPTLAGIKTANMFNYLPDDMEKLHQEIQEENCKLNSKGVYVEILRTGEKRALIYVYRKNRLEADLNGKGAESILQTCGYECGETDCCLRKLQERFFQYECGIWKVYGDEHKSRMTFQKLKKCSEIYQRLFADGRSILQLTVAA